MNRSQECACSLFNEKHLSSTTPIQKLSRETKKNTESPERCRGQRRKRVFLEENVPSRAERERDSPGQPPTQ